MYNLEDDINHGDALKVFGTRAGRPSNPFLFDPVKLNDQLKDCSTNDYVLDQATLLEYGKVVTLLRSAIDS